MGERARERERALDNAVYNVPYQHKKRAHHELAQEDSNLGRLCAH